MDVNVVMVRVVEYCRRGTVGKTCGKYGTRRRRRNVVVVRLVVMMHGLDVVMVVFVLMRRLRHWVETVVSTEGHQPSVLTRPSRVERRVLPLAWTSGQ